MRRWIVAAATCLAFGLSAMTLPALAEDAAVQVVSTTPGLLGGQFQTGAAPFETEIRLRNAAPEPRRLVPGGLLIRAGDGHAEPATWARKGGTGDVLAAGAEAVMTLQATLAGPGVYTSWIDSFPLSGSGGERIRFEVTRTIEAIPAELMVDPKAVAFDVGFWTLPVRLMGLPGGAPERTLIGLRNTTTRPLEFTAPQLLSFTRQSGNAQTSVATASLPRVEPGDCQSPLAPGAACSFALKLAGDMVPGQYAIGVGVAGVGGGWSERSQIVHVRASWFLAFLVLLAGGASAALITGWRSGGRRAASGLVDIERARERLKLLLPDPADADSKTLLAGTLGRLAAIEDSVRGGADPTEPLAGLDAHIGQLQALIAIGKGLAGIAPDGRAALEASRAALVAKVDIAAPAADKAGLDKALRDLAGDATLWPSLEADCNAALALARSIADEQSAADGDGDRATAGQLVKSLDTAVKEARAASPARATSVRIATLATAVSDARAAIAAYAKVESAKLGDMVTPLLATAKANHAPEVAAIETMQAQLAALSSTTAAPDTVETALGEIAALWKRYRALDVAVNGATPQVTTLAPAAGPGFAVAGLPALDAPVDLLLPPTGATLSGLEKATRRNEWLTNGAILVATALAGVVALWSPDPDWGSAVNLITAFLAGMGANVVIGSAAARQ